MHSSSEFSVLNMYNHGCPMYWKRSGSCSCLLPMSKKTNLMALCAPAEKTQ